MSTPPETDILHRIRAWLRSDMVVLRWVFLALYVILLLEVSALFLVPSAGDRAAFWLILIGVMLVAQALFILGGGTINLCFPIRRRRLWMPVLAASFMLALLVFGFLLAMIEFFKMEESSGAVTILFWTMVLGSWLFWAVMIWAYAVRAPRMRVLSRLAALLFAGSLAELLATVPAHLVVSKRSGCVVGVYTMIGITAGVYVMTFAFGPAIVLLFLRPRYRHEQSAPFCGACGYNLTGTLAAGRVACPECGADIPAYKQSLTP